MERSNFSLRIPASPMKGLQHHAEQDKVSVNQLIVIAIAEKLALLDAPYVGGTQAQGDGCRSRR
jgi:hypothetical protein